MLFLTILRRIQYDIFESSVRRRQNCIDNVFICFNFAKDFGGILSTGQIDNNVVCAQKYPVSDERQNDHQGPVSRKSRNFTSHFLVSQFLLYLKNGEDVSRQTLRTCFF